MTTETQAPDPGPVGLLGRAIDLHEKASMPWPEAERLALSEAGVADAVIDEVIGEAGGLEMLLTTPDDLRDFARSVLVHGSHRISTGPTVDLRAIAEQAGMRVDLLSMGAASMVYSEGCEGVTREHLERFAALYGFACWNAALAANPPNMQSFVSGALDSIFPAPEGAQGDRDRFEAYLRHETRWPSIPASFERLPDGTYADKDTQRHWWTWQQARAALAAPAPQAPAWQPIETAPKDRTEILGWTPACGALVLYWENLSDGGRWSDGMSYFHREPTHWMPLPAEPQTKEPKA